MNKDSKYINTFCTGCGLCHCVNNTSWCIKENGFPNAKVDEEDTSFFQNVCPVFYYSDDVKHDVWGNVESASIAYSANADVRFKAASGGAITEICSYLLEKRIVDGIIHTTYAPNEPTKTISCVSTSIEELIERCGSRYSISTPLLDIVSLMEDGKKYAFVGKPCDVMALKRYMSVDTNISDRIAYLISFFCAGEPSVKAQENLLNAMGTTINDCECITYRGNGWPGYTTAISKDGEKHTIEYSKAWGNYLGRDIRYICRFCMDGTGDAADIVCADFWQLKNDNTPDFSEHEGRNIIISRNEKGKRLVEEVFSSGRLTFESDFIDKMADFHLYQPAQYRRKGTMNSMIAAMKLCGRLVPKYNKEYLRLYSSHVSNKVKRDYFVGIIKRVLKGRI